MKILLLVCFSILGLAFDNDELSRACLDQDFKVKISHKSFPLGLLSKVVSIQKERCVIEVEHTSYKFLKKNWKIDVCREPVHIKSGAYGVEVHKKINSCEEKAKNLEESFCSNYLALKLIILDDALIFAKGEKEDLESDHGKAYCAYSLIKKYAEEEKIFSRSQSVNKQHINEELSNKTEPAQSNLEAEKIDDNIDGSEPFAPTVESVKKLNKKTNIKN